MTDLLAHSPAVGAGAGRCALLPTAVMLASSSATPSVATSGGRASRTPPPPLPQQQADERGKKKTPNGFALLLLRMPTAYLLGHE